MIKNGKGGGNTKTGLVFEGKTDLATFLNSQEGYRVTDGVVFYNDEKVARIFKKHGFYRYLKEVGVDWTKIISKKLLPDDSIYVAKDNRKRVSAVLRDRCFEAQADCSFARTGLFRSRDSHNS